MTPGGLVSVGVVARWQVDSQSVSGGVVARWQVESRQASECRSGRKVAG